MAVEITGTYQDGLKVEVEHGPSGTKLLTAAPVDNQGDGSSFSPTDLTAAALGACMLTIIGILGERHRLDLAGSHFRATKNMRDDPRRIGSVPVEIHLPESLPSEHRTRLERGALTCPVHRSLLDDIPGPVTFHYDV